MQMIKTEFVYNKGFKWYTEDNVSIKGFLYDAENNFYEKESFLHFVKKIDSKDKLLQVLKKATGLFTIYIQFPGNKFLLANDIIRPFPVFYKLENNKIHLSDDIHILIKEKPIEINPISEIEFKSAGFVSGHNTLIENIYTTQSGELIEYQNNKIEIISHFYYNTKETSQKEYPELERESIQVIRNVFTRLIQSLNNKLAVIPLSGGLDSRLIACMLKELDYKNVLCYTFGRKENNPEKEISEKVAKALNFDWVFIEYNQQNVGDFLNASFFGEYYQYYSQYASSFMFQDFFAVKYLKEKKLIPQDAVFIPGYSGDFLGGSQLYKNGGIKEKTTTRRIAKNIVNERYINTKLNRKEKQTIRKKVEKQICTQSNDKDLAYSIFENWEIKENLSKFIGQTTRIYDFWEYEYRLPFWDLEFINFFKHIPYKYKYGKPLYNNSLFFYFKNQQVDFKYGINLNPKEFKIYSLKKKIKKHLPYVIKRRISQTADILNYDLILSDIKDELRKNKKIKEKYLLTQNSYLAHWYLKKIKESNRNL